MFFLLFSGSSSVVVGSFNLPTLGGFEDGPVRLAKISTVLLMVQYFKKVSFFRDMYYIYCQDGSQVLMPDGPGIISNVQSMCKR